MPSWINALRAHYRWVIVAAGGTLGCLAIGGLFSLPVFLRPIAQDTGCSTTGISTAMTFAFVVLALGSIAWGALSDRVGPRIVVLAGSLLLATGLALASLATSLPAFQLWFGAVVGLGAAAIFAPMMACVTGWFDTRRALAVSLVSAGMGMAPMTLSPLAAWLVQAHSWPHLAADLRGAGGGDHAAGGVAGAPPACAGASRGGGPGGRGARAGPVRRAGAALGAVPDPGADQLPQLRHALGADLRKRTAIPS